MKQPIDWHERSLKSMENYVATLQERTRREIKDCLVACHNLEFYRLQVEEAKRQGKDGFEAERFLQKRKLVNFECNNIDHPVGKESENLTRRLK